MVATVALFIEYEAVLTREEHMRAAGINRSDIDIALDALSAVAVRVEPHFLWRPKLRDPDDDMVLEAAINGRADAIVTFNVRHFADVAPQFDIQVCPPSEILRRLSR
jgi:predicted nucleic acid-binding protein